MRYKWFACYCVLALRAIQAEQLSVAFDKAKTQLSFALAASLHTVHGTFQFKDGQLSLNPSTGEMTGVVIVDASSGDSGNSTRDRRMTKDILEADRYPDARFTPAKLTGSVAPSGNSTVQVSGSFMLHGASHEITIPVQIQVTQSEFKATGAFTVPYVQWGMKNPSNFLLKVSDKVEVEFTAVGHVSNSHSP